MPGRDVAPERAALLHDLLFSVLEIQHFEADTIQIRQRSPRSEQHRLAARQQLRGHVESLTLLELCQYFRLPPVGRHAEEATGGGTEDDRLVRTPASPCSQSGGSNRLGRPAGHRNFA